MRQIRLVNILQPLSGYVYFEIQARPDPDSQGPWLLLESYDYRGEAEDAFTRLKAYGGKSSVVTELEVFSCQPQ